MNSIFSLKKRSKIVFVCAVVCILMCIGIVFWYNSFGYKLFDNICYYDNDMNFHYFNGLRKPISCIMYIILILIIIIMVRVIIKTIYPNKKLNISTYIRSSIICILILGLLVYQLFDLDINHIIVGDNGFYKIDHLIIHSQFEEYQFSYFDNHAPKLLGNEVFFCEIKNNEDNVGWKRELFIGQYTDNIDKLMSELDHRTKSKYQLVSQLNKSK